MRQEKVTRVRIDVERIFLETEKLLIHSTIPRLKPANRNRGKSPPQIQDRPACLPCRAQMPVQSHAKCLRKTCNTAARDRAGNCALVLESIVKIDRCVLPDSLAEICAEEPVSKTRRRHPG